MSPISPVDRYFELSPRQIEQFAALDDLYRYWNQRINVVSRKDIDMLYTNHVLHSLAIAAVCRFEQGTRVCDVGCGGGFPTVPLAILFPEAKFTAVDSIGKKIKVLDEVVKGLELLNVATANCRIETLGERFDYCVSRAVTDLKSLAGWTMPLLDAGQRGTLPNGLLVLKGGDLTEELKASGRAAEVFDISAHFAEPFFETKKVVYLRKSN